MFLVFGARQPSIDEWRGAMDAVLADPAFRTGMGFVSDRRALTDAPTSAMVQLMVAYEYEHRQDFGECLATRRNVPTVRLLHADEDPFVRLHDTEAAARDDELRIAFPDGRRIFGLDPATEKQAGRKAEAFGDLADLILCQRREH